MNNQILLSRNQAAAMLNIGVTTLWRLTKRGQIPAVKIGSRCLYHRDILIQFAEGEMHAMGSMEVE
jgi:excisionase family DNA binding protein